MRTILIVGGGYAGFCTAWKLEKKLRRGEARVIVVDPRPYMTFQPFLPEVVAGSVEARYAAVSRRRHLKKTEILAGRVCRIDHAHKTFTVRPAVGQPHRLVIKRFPAWLMHRGYHVLAVPTWERRFRVLAVRATAVPFGHDIVSLTSVQHPQEEFLAGAARAHPHPPKGRVLRRRGYCRATPRVHDDVVRRLAAARQSGEVVAIGAALDPDVVAVCDSGGRVRAPIRPVHGAANVARLLHALLSGTELTIETVNGRAGLVIRRAGIAVAVIAVSCDEGRAATVWVVLNPVKLRGWHRR